MEHMKPIKNKDAGCGKFSKLRIVVGIAALVMFAVILCCVQTGAIAGFDDAIRSFFYDLRSDSLTPFVKAVTYIGNWQGIVILCVVLLAVKPLRLTYGVPVSIGAVFVTILNKLIKNAVQRPRPDDILHLVNEGGFSFSSGHSITSMFVFGMLIYLVRTNVENRTLANVLTVILAIPMICIGVSRIYLGVHYPSDVLAGWCLGIAVIMAMVEVMKRCEARHTAKEL